MRDYFSNLIDRTLGRTPSVTPRQASLFAPSPYMDGVLGAVPVEPLFTEEREQAETLNPAPTRKRPGLPVQPLQSSDSDRDAETRATLREHTFARESSSNPSVTTGETIIPTVERIQVVRRDTETIMPKPLSSLSAERPPIENRIETIRIVERTKHDVESMPRQHRESLRGEETPSDKRPREVTSAAPASVPRPRPILLQPQVIAVPAAARVAAPVAPPQPANAPTTVQVTIGRIEVRATTSTAPTRQRQAQPRLSLDEYLRQRNRGGK